MVLGLVDLDVEDGAEARELKALHVGLEYHLPETPNADATSYNCGFVSHLISPGARARDVRGQLLHCKLPY